MSRFETGMGGQLRRRAPACGPALGIGIATPVALVW